MKKLVLLLSLALAGCSKTREIPASNLVVLGVGTSVTWGEKNTPGNTPNDYALRALDTTASLIKLGYRGESAGQWNRSHRQEFLDSLAIVPTGHPTLLIMEWGLNDLNVAPKEVVLADILRASQWAHDTAHVSEVLIIPCFNRTDKWGFTREADGTESHHFNESRIWLNKQLHSRVSGWSWARVGNETDSPAMYSDSYPSDKKRCADEVHPTDEGAEDLGVGTIAHGIASFGKVHLK